MPARWTTSSLEGDQGEDIEEDNEDPEGFLEVLAEVVDRYEWMRHAYCLMTNRDHPVIETMAGD